MSFPCCHMSSYCFNHKYCIAFLTLKQMKKKLFAYTDQVPSVVEEIAQSMHRLDHNNGLCFFHCRVHTTAMDRDYWENILTPYTVRYSHFSLIKWYQQCACSYVYSFINEFRCYEAKVEEDEKADRESSPGHLWLEPPVLFQ